MTLSQPQETIGYDPTAPAALGDGIALHDSGRTGSDRRAVRRAIVPADIRELVKSQRMTRADSRASLLHNLALAAAWALLTLVAVAADSLYVWVPVWVAQAFLLHGAYSAMHDGAHGSMFPTRRGNQAANFLWAIPLGINGNLWRCWHLEHHRATATPDDPEPSADITNLALYVVAFPAAGVMMFVQFQYESLLTLFGRFPGYADRPAVRPAVRRDAAWMLLLTAAVVVAAVTQPHWLLWLWVIPLVAYWCGVSLIFALPEHLGTTRDPAATQIDVTRTTQSNKLVEFLIWNSNRHTAHHLVPTVNYRYLPAVDDALGDRVPNRADSYWSYHVGLIRSFFSRD